MSRKPRKKSESQIYHVILRGNNRQSIFFNDADRFFIINRIQKYSEQTNIELEKTGTDLDFVFFFYKKIIFFRIKSHG